MTDEEKKSNFRKMFAEIKSTVVQLLRIWKKYRFVQSGSKYNMCSFMSTSRTTNKRA